MAGRQGTDFTGRNTCGLSLRISDGSAHREWHFDEIVTFPSRERPIQPLYSKNTARLGQQYYIRSRKRDTVDYALLRTWMQLCHTQHGERCSRPPYYSFEAPVGMRLIDVYARAVVDAPAGVDYVALSYVWGGSQPVATSSDLSILPWRLPPSGRMAKTIDHAMHVTKQLGQRYIWVDAFCITQEPPSNPDKAHQLAQMDRIYSNATLTIMASSCTSAMSGIPGVEDRNVVDYSLKLDGLALAISPPTLEEDVAGGVWHTRGWTFQEQILTKRSLVLGRDQAFWLCQCDAWCEGIVAEPPDGEPCFIPSPHQADSGPPERSFSLNMVGYNEHDVYENLVGGYTMMVRRYASRKLSDPSDGLNAVYGILNVLTREYPSYFGNIYQGLPESCFDFALLWRPLGRCTRPIATRQSQSLPPSWTWAGWIGEGFDGVDWDHTLAWKGRPEVGVAIDWFLVDDRGRSDPIARRERQIREPTVNLPPRPCGLPEGYAACRKVMRPAGRLCVEQSAARPALNPPSRLPLPTFPHHLEQCLPHRQARAIHDERG